MLGSVMTRKFVRIAAGCAVCAGAVLVTGGCGHGGGRPAAGSSVSPRPSSPSPTSESPTPSGPSAVSGSPAGGGTGAGGACAANGMRYATRPEGAAAGHHYAVLQLTNAGGAPCTVSGVPGLQLLTAQGRAVPTSVTPDTSTATVQTLTLPPGASAWSRLGWGAVPGQGDAASGPCQPTPSQVAVTPPGQSGSVTTAWAYGSVCEQGKIRVTPLVAGTGPSGPGGT